MSAHPEPTIIDPIAFKNPGQIPTLVPALATGLPRKEIVQIRGIVGPVLPPPSDEAYYLLESQMNTVESAIKWGPIRDPDGQLYRDLYAWLLAVEAGEWIP